MNEVRSICKRCTKQQTACRAPPKRLLQQWLGLLASIICKLDTYTGIYGRTRQNLHNIRTCCRRCTEVVAYGHGACICNKLANDARKYRGGLVCSSLRWLMPWLHAYSCHYLQAPSLHTRNAAVDNARKIASYKETNPNVCMCHVPAEHIQGGARTGEYDSSHVTTCKSSASPAAQCSA